MPGTKIQPRWGQTPWTIHFQPKSPVRELPHAAELPGVRRKLANLGQRSAAKRASDYDRLTAVLARRRTI